MSDIYIDPDTGMSFCPVQYDRMFRPESIEGEQEVVDEIGDATIAVESLQKSIRLDQE